MTIPAYKIETVILGYCTFTNTDLTEGKGSQYIKHHCLSRTTALRLAKGIGVQGSSGAVEPLPLFRVNVNGEWHTYGPVNVYLPSREDEAVDRARAERETALEKAKALGLSDEEIAALRT